MEKMRLSILVAAALCANPMLAQDGGDQFEAPIELLTNGDSITSVFFPSPTLYDLDGDGVRELVIGDLKGSIHSSTKLDGKVDAWGEMVKLESVDGEPLKLNNW